MAKYSELLKFQMKIPFLYTTFCIAVVFAVGGADASTFDLRGSIGGSSSSNAFPAASVGFLVADTSGNGFQFQSDTSLLLGASSASKNSFLGTSDDFVFAINLPLIDFGSGQNGFEIPNQPFDTAVTSGWGINDAFALVWFQNGTSGVGDSFGFYRSSTIYSNNGSNVAFATPGNGEFVLNDLATGVPGITNPSTPVASFTANNGTIAAVPEPSVILLIAFAPILLKLFRSLRSRVA